jgi:uncharacterized membrane protein YtjA (UPF0391 family)
MPVSAIATYTSNVPGVPCAKTLQGPTEARFSPNYRVTRPALAKPPRCRKDGVRRKTNMLRWALIFFVISIVAAIFGFGGISEATADIAQILFYVFLGIFVVMLILGLVAGKKIAG